MDKSGLKHCIQVTIEYLDLLMNDQPTQEIANASNLLQEMVEQL